MSALILIVALLVLMWFLLIRPQRKRQMEQRQMLGKIELGDEIVTAGGLYGTVRAIDDDELRVEIAPGTTVRIARRAATASSSSESRRGRTTESCAGARSMTSSASASTATRSAASAWGSRES